MDPPYQRKGRRWSKSDKQYLIDSIINGFDVPKFYVTDFTWGPSDLNRNASAYAVIDGKQRFEAIFDFFDGKIATSNDFKYIPDPNINAAGLTLEQLRNKFPTIAEEFENFNPIIMGVVTSEKRYIEELFVRLNRSRPLTGAEIRNAMSGPVPELVRQICAHDFFKINSKFPTGSGQDLNLAAKILMFEYHETLENTKKENLDRFTSTSSYDEDLLSSKLDSVLKNLDTLSNIFFFEDDLLGSEGPIPVYYWFVRNLPPEVQWEARDFLEEFLSAVKERNKDAFQSGNLLANLEKYATALRSINDKSSHERRFEILNRLFAIWRAERIL
jgi:hypothetical protein